MAADSAHCIDRIAVALGEAPGSNIMLSRGRSMLLHYAVLRRIVAHPLQRPLSLTPNLSAQPWWEISSLERETPALPRTGWLDTLLDPASVAAMQHELPPVGSSPSAAQPQQEGVHTGGSWEEVHLMVAGRWDLAGEAAFPETARLLQASGVERDMINARYLTRSRSTQSGLQSWRKCGHFTPVFLGDLSMAGNGGCLSHWRGTGSACCGGRRTLPHIVECQTRNCGCISG